MDGWVDRRPLVQTCIVGQFSPLVPLCATSLSLLSMNRTRGWSIKRGPARSSSRRITLIRRSFRRSIVTLHRSSVLVFLFSFKGRKLTIRVACFARRDTLAFGFSFPDTRTICSIDFRSSYLVYIVVFKFVFLSEYFIQLCRIHNEHNNRCFEAS